jgi:hypothetical protein
MTGVRDHRKHRIGNEAPIGFAEFRRHESVILSPDQQGRHVDAVQPFREVRIHKARIGKAHDRAAIAHQQVRIGRREHLQPAPHAIGIEIEPARILFRAHAEHVVQRHAVGGDPDGADEREACQPRGVANRKLGRDPAAERGADQMNAVELQRFDHVEVEVGKIARAIEPWRVVRAAEPRMFRRERVECPRQTVEKRQPADMPAGAVQKDQRWTAAASQQANPRAAHVKHDLRRRHRSMRQHRHLAIGVHLPPSNLTNRSGSSTTLP